MVKDRFERNWPYDLIKQDVYYLDLLKFREVSNAIEDKLDVGHQSPQVLIIDNKACIYSANHNFINAETIKRELIA